MKDTRLIMGMPITVEIVDELPESLLESVFTYFTSVDKRYSTYKPGSEISRINTGLPQERWSAEMRRILTLCEQTKQETAGYFDISRHGRLDPSGLVKGWAIRQAARRLTRGGAGNFYIEAGGDIQVRGHNQTGQPWRVGIRNPFLPEQQLKVLIVTTEGIATSGTYERGQHIYNPHDGDSTIEAVKSLTVVGVDIYEADRFATAAFAMGRKGMDFIEATPGLEGYMVDADQLATYTSGFERYVAQ